MTTEETTAQTTEQTAPQQQDQNPTLTLKLSLKDINLVIAGVQEIPFKVADPLIKNIVAQAQEQIKTLQDLQNS